MFNACDMCCAERAVRSVGVRLLGVGLTDGLITTPQSGRLLRRRGVLRAHGRPQDVL